MPEPTEWRLDDAAAEYFETHFVPAIFSAWAPILLDAGGVSQGQRVLDVACFFPASFTQAPISFCRSFTSVVSSHLNP